MTEDDWWGLLAASGYRDAETWLVFADWLEEQEDGLRAEAVRWARERERRPAEYVWGGHLSPPRGVYTWWEPGGHGYAGPWPGDEVSRRHQSMVPLQVWKELTETAEHWSWGRQGKDYDPADGLRGPYEDLLRAYAVARRKGWEP